MPNIDDLKLNPTESPVSVLPKLRVRVVTSGGALIEAPARLSARTRRGDIGYGQLIVGDEILLHLHDGVVWEPIVSVTAL